MAKPTCSRGAPLIFGSGALGGAQPDLLAAPAADFQLLRISDGIDTEAGLIPTDDLATGWARARTADLPPGGTVVVISLGAVGLCAVRSVIAVGGVRKSRVDPVEGRRQPAAEFGATPFILALLESIMAATGGRRAASAIDAVGNHTTTPTR